jgi:hypothetical protein
MVKDLWTTRDLPVLQAIGMSDADGRRVERIEHLYGVDELADEQVVASVRALFRAGYIDGIEVSSMDGFDMLEIEPTAEGRRAIGSWPSRDAYADLLRLLEDRIDRADDEERSALRRARDAFVDLGKDVGANIIATLMMRQSGM